MTSHNWAAEQRATLVRRAFWPEWLTAAWMAIEAAVALGSGVAAHSISLIAFGADSLIELVSAGVLLWRLSVELSHGDDFPEAIERHASRISGGLLFTLAAYVLASAGYGLWRQEGQDFPTAGFILAALAMPMMYVLANVKIRLVTQLGSRSLRADAVESIACGYLSGTVLVGLLGQLVIGAWWVDSVTALAIVWFVVKEGHEVWSGEDEPPA